MELKKFACLALNTWRLINGGTMKNKVLKVKYYNWNGLKEEKEWIIYDDMSVDFSIESYLTNAEKKSTTLLLNKSEYEKIFNEINISRENETFIAGNDGNGWSFTEYKNNIVVWKMDPGYIDSNEPLKNITNILQSKSREFEIKASLND